MNRIGNKNHIMLARALSHCEINQTINGKRPKAIGNGSPGNMPLLSSILKARKAPTSTPAAETKKKVKFVFTST